MNTASPSSVRRTLAGRKALLVLDGAENADDLPAILAIRDGCAVLVTTRPHHDAPDAWLDVRRLPLDKAKELLLAWGRSANTPDGRSPWSACWRWHHSSGMCSPLPCRDSSPASCTAPWIS